MFDIDLIDYRQKRGRLDSLYQAALTEDVGSHLPVILATNLRLLTLSPIFSEFIM
jgi:hypothetical protein